jgi:hypothetical protein
VEPSWVMLPTVLVISANMVVPKMMPAVVTTPPVPVHFSSVLPTFTNTELISGTSGAKLLKNTEPEDIANAIIRLITKPAARVAVTRVAGIITGSMKFLPKSTGEFVARRIGMEHVFLDDVDNAARKAYEDRARRIES